MRTTVGDITRLLQDGEVPQDQRVAALLPLVYDQLRQIAAAQMSRERCGHTLQATALVHEAYARLAGDYPVAWAGRRHFFAAAAEAMRRILIEHARAARAVKRGGGRRRVPLSVLDLAETPDPDWIEALDHALELLAAAHPRQADLVRLRFYAGLSIDDAAQALGVARRTAVDDWCFARAFLARALRRQGLLGPVP